MQITRYMLILLVMAIFACAGRSYRTYPDNGSIVYLDSSVGPVGGNVDGTGVTMHYKGALKETIEDLGPIEAKVSKRNAKKADVLRELQIQVQKKNADGVYDVLVAQDGETWEASGLAFRFRR